MNIPRRCRGEGIAMNYETMVDFLNSPLGTIIGFAIGMWLGVKAFDWWNR